MRRVKYLPTIVVSIIVVVFTFYNFTPFGWMVSTSFKSEKEAYRIPPTVFPQKPTTESYEQIIIWTNFPRYFFNSTVVSLGASLLSTIVGALAGYGFSRFIFRGRTFLIGAILASQMLPGVLLVGPYFKLLTRVALYNTYIGLILAFTTITLPFSTWMMKGFIDTVPRELDMAGLVDGCSYPKVFLNLVFPIITPGMVATIIFAFILAWGDLLWVLVLTSGEAMTTVTLGLSRLVTQFRIIWPQLMAGSVIGALPPVTLYLILQKNLVRGLTAGAVKE
ncbi:MAG: carbohydrate ABC transporter permease [Spirochaetes bacterium]|nr:MAG: carbohydrate ABC transporter permease [Spirochaetota bacterium]